MALASIRGGHEDLTFRVNPNSIQWDYNLKTSVEETKGGKVVQLLGVNLSNLVVQLEAGTGGRPYLRYILTYFRDLLLWQRDTQGFVNFRYPNRGWDLKVQFSSLRLNDTLDNDSFPYSLNFNVSEDVNGISTQDVRLAALQAIKRGIGYRENEYNQLPGSSIFDLDPPEAPDMDRPHPFDDILPSTSFGGGGGAWGTDDQSTPRGTSTGGISRGQQMR